MIDLSKYKIILASASPRRKEILEKTIERFEIIPSNTDEDYIMSKFHSKDYSSLAINLSLMKAQDISNKNPDAIVIGADTIVICDDILLGKPKDNLDAYNMLNLISNNFNIVITGVTIIYNEYIYSFSEKTTLKLKSMDDKFIKDYITSGEPFDKSGGYGIQSIKDDFLESIDGDINNVIGFPLNKFKLEFDKFLNLILSNNKTLEK